MPIISRVEANSPRGKMLYASIIFGLTLGGVTMVYPFVIMLSGTVRSEMDETDLDVVPEYMAKDAALYRKFLETKYNQAADQLNRSHGRLNFDFDGAALPGAPAPERKMGKKESAQELADAAAGEKKVEPAAVFSQAQADDLKGFIEETKDWPKHWSLLGASLGVKTIPENLRALTEKLKGEYDGDIQALARDLGVAMTLWDFRGFLPPDWMNYRYDFEPNALYRGFFELTEERPWAERQMMSVSGYFVETMILPVYGRDGIDRYNEVHKGQITSIEHYVLTQHVPGEDEPKLRAEWIEFVTKELNPSFVSLRGVEDSAYRAFLVEKYGDVVSLNKSWAGSYKSMDEIRLPRRVWLSGTRRLDYLSFMAEQKPEHYEIDAPEYAFRVWVKGKYATVDALNAAWRTSYGDFAQVYVPMDQLEWAYVKDHAWSLRWKFAVRNYINVYDAMFVQGRAFLNTSILCLLTVFSALLVNPLAAYAMSRFKLPGTYKVLLILMATMSFPPMVTTIPTFIMLRKLEMLNTFWALVLPGIANGYMIFLLKGFFDSLPQDLYEAALIDGAGEFRMFFQITMALSKPILAVVALGAFNAAYTMFLYALIVCPDPDMWLLNVYLLQYQQQVSMGGMFAAVLVAAIPPLVIFLFAQNIIMRGIVVPVEK